MKRVLIIGNGGAGKSMLARKLGALTGLPVIHLDVEFWRPGWVETPDEEWDPHVAELLKGEHWIIDGNYGGTMDLRIAAADTVVFLDLPTRVCIWRIIDRALGGREGGRRRPDMADGCDEKLDPPFIDWVYHYRERNRPRVLALLEGARAWKTVVRLTSDRAVDRWLGTIGG